jgi:hypothetical protein
MICTVQMTGYMETAFLSPAMSIHATKAMYFTMVFASFAASQTSLLIRLRQATKILQVEQA